MKGRELSISKKIVFVIEYCDMFLKVWFKINKFWVNLISSVFVLKIINWRMIELESFEIGIWFC